MKVAIASDHAGFDYKSKTVKFLKKKEINVIDMGPKNDKSVDYPDFAHSVSDAVENKNVEFGILFCGSGNGINMSANKHQGIRSALCWKKEIAELARKHNNANVLALPARFISYKEVKEIVTVFLATDFERGRHEKRVKKISNKQKMFYRYQINEIK